MPFTPVNDRNAVLEAILTISLNRAVFPPELTAVRNAHRDLELDLPKLDQTQTMFLGQAPPPNVVAAMPSVGPISMSSFQRDGTVDSRLSVSGNVIAINFLVYTSWDEHWDRASLWLDHIVRAMVAQATTMGLPPLHVQNIAHQVIDVFKWTGNPADVGVHELLCEPTHRLPSAATTARGQAWTAMHSFIEPVAQPGVGQLVDWLGCDLNDEPRFGWRVRLDNVLEFRLSTPETLADVFEAQADRRSLVANASSVLHARNRTVMLALLTSEMASRIGLKAKK